MLAYKPFPEEPTLVLNFEGQPAEPAPDLGVAYLDSVEFMGLTIPVDDRDILTTTEITILALLGLGATNRSIFEIVGKLCQQEHTSHRSRLTLFNIYTALGVSVRPRTARCHGLGLAFKQGILLADPQAEQKLQHSLVFPSGLYERLRLLAPLLAEGNTVCRASEVLGKSYRQLVSWKQAFQLELGLGATAMVMLAGGLGLIPRDPEPVSAGLVEE